MSEHTPGPWAAFGKSVMTAATLGGICNCLGGSFDKYKQDQIAKANARLISAAPEMLEALEDAVACGLIPITSAREGGAARFSEQVRAADMVRAAIAKAKGESKPLATSEEKSE